MKYRLTVKAQGWSDLRAIAETLERLHMTGTVGAEGTVSSRPFDVDYANVVVDIPQASMNYFYAWAAANGTSGDYANGSLLLWNTVE